MIGTFEAHVWSYLLMWPGKTNREAAAEALALRIIGVLSNGAPRRIERGAA
jgi:hypothetical protein